MSDPPKHLIELGTHCLQLPKDVCLVSRYSVSCSHWTHAPDSVNLSPSMHSLNSTDMAIAELYKSKKSQYECYLVLF